ncbi:Glycosyltransferase [Hyella patelloides LEGE 07179]|uniref:Glycosyltransferase n=1 Tax=Hyella patelloides LEGE 07179 TaxID=945734 RepID=A0A563VLF4_9CYAN|nr:glycosyltransferase [Hyella patelloides]VEP12251.1 Glycosyltransferase [Hyella patelloides LEGE 07179]
MKILCVTPYLGKSYGGTSKVVTEIAQELGSFNCNIDLITTNANDKNILDVSLNTWIDNINYRVQYFSCWHRSDFIFSLSLIKWLYKNVTNYDLVHTNTIFSPLISVVHGICKLQNIPYIATLHGMLEPWALSYKAGKKRYYYQFLEKPLLKQANAIHTLASSEAERVQNLGLSKTIIIPNGIHRQDYQILPNSDIFYQQFPHTRHKTLILFLGRIDPKKGLDLLAPAFAQAYQKFPNAHLIVAGPDSINFMPTATQYFQDVGCQDAVTFTGMLKGDLKLAALAAADIYVAPSYSEGFSMSVLEGMASSLPCIITTGCNFPEAAEAKVAHVVDIDAESITEALITCLQQPQEAKAMGMKARQFIFDNYTWDIAAKKLVRVYQQILARQNYALESICSN